MSKLEIVVLLLSIALLQIALIGFLNINISKLEIVVLLFGIALFLIASLPGIIANLYDRKVIRSVKSKENYYTMPQTCWLLTKIGIIISFISLVVIVIGLFFCKYFVRDWLGIHVKNNTKDMVGLLGVCFVFILSSLMFSGLYIADFRKHKNDYIRLDGESIEICYESQKDTVYFSQIEKIDVEKNTYEIYQKDGPKLKIPKSMVNRLIGRDTLNEKLKELSSLYPSRA